MINNISENLTGKERNNQWMYMIFNKDKIKAKTEQWTKEAEEAGMTLTEYLESISPLNNKEKLSWLGKNCKDCGNEKCKKLGILPRGYSCALWQAESESKEKKMQEYKSKQLIDELSKMPSMVIETAYLYAVNYVRYGEDVTKKWITAVQNASALEKAYRKGYYDALQRRAESEE